ncbi:MAG: tetratricopeptide repeat protein [Nitrospirae bacterium]|nr:MAG: tetratricopeptide repeat protein [Nitrospirota bacterium]
MGPAETALKRAFKLHKAGRFEDAVTAYGEALNLFPDSYEAHFNRGMALQSLGRLNEAVISYGRALSIMPDAAEAHYNLGIIYVEKGRMNAAEACFKRAVQSKADYIEAINNLANVQKEMGKLSQALENYSAVLRLSPDFAYAYNGMAGVLQETGDVETAIEYYAKALSIKEDYVIAHSNMLLALNYIDSKTPEEVFEEHLRFAAVHAGPLSKDILPYRCRPTEGRKLRIAYISPDFRCHSVGFFIEPVLMNHNKESFDIYCYSDVAVPDDVTRRIEGYATAWVDICGMSDEEVSERIRSDSIDILVDLAGHTGYNRILVFARKPAPVQISWIGYPNTTGLKTMDYRIVDGYTDPEGMTDPYYTEELIRLRNGFLCYLPNSASGGVGPLPALDKGHITFGSFNKISKITPRAVALWASILKRVENSRLLLKARGLDEKDMKAKIAAMFAGHGVDGSRIVFMSRTPDTASHLEVYNTVDIALDSFPYNGTTTTCEALWMGVPVIVMKGHTHAALVGVSILSNIKLHRLIAANDEEYINIAVSLASDLNALAETRLGIRGLMKGSPLFDYMTFTREIENVYRGVWGRYCKDVGRNNVVVQEEMAAAVQLHNAGKLYYAQNGYKDILKVEPDNADALHLLGTLKFQLKEYRAAVELISRAIELDPSSALFYFSLANIFAGMGLKDAAEDHYEKAISLEPDFGAAYFNLANLHLSAEDFDKARICYRKAIDLDLNPAQSYFNIGTIQFKQKHFEEAIKSFNTSARFEPGRAETFLNIALSYQELNKFPESVECYKKALALKPDYTLASFNFGVTLFLFGKLSEALICFSQVIDAEPDHVDALNNLGNVYRELGMFDASERFFRKAIEANPNLPHLWSNILYLKNFNPDITLQEMFVEHLKYEKHFGVPAHQKRPLSIPDMRGRRIRVGYVSADFRRHSVSYFFEPVLRNHDKGEFEIFCYSNGFLSDGTTVRIRQSAEHWRNIYKMDAGDAEDLIKGDGIDILVDLAGHTGFNSMNVFLRKPAPVQVSWIGYPNTTGLSTMDYRLVDKYTDPEGLTDGYNTEKLIRMPDSFLCYLPDRESPDVAVSEHGCMTFGSFNLTSKINAYVVEVWSEILKRTPGSKLLLKARYLDDATLTNRIISLFGSKGIPSERVRIAPFEKETAAHLKIYSQVDIALDTFPYNGTTTTCESIWMGVPLIALEGNDHRSRVGVSLLSNLGLQEFIAKSVDEYVNIAVRLAEDKEKLKTLRRTLRNTLMDSPLMNASGFTRKVEQYYKSFLSA